MILFDDAINALVTTAADCAPSIFATASVTHLHQKLDDDRFPVIG